ANYHSVATYADQFWFKDPHHPELGAASLTDLFLRMLENFFRLSAHLFELAARMWVEPVWYSPAVLLPLVVIVLGLLVSLVQCHGYVEWYFLTYMVIFLLWPYDVGARFVLPVFPLAFLYGWRGATWLVKSALRRLQ